MNEFQRAAPTRAHPESHRGEAELFQAGDNYDKDAQEALVHEEP